MKNNSKMFAFKLYNFFIAIDRGKKFSRFWRFQHFWVCVFVDWQFKCSTNFTIVNKMNDKSNIASRWLFAIIAFWFWSFSFGRNGKMSFSKFALLWAFGRFVIENGSKTLFKKFIILQFSNVFFFNFCYFFKTKKFKLSKKLRLKVV